MAQLLFLSLESTDITLPAWATFERHILIAS
jgi:hypothetical protein